MKRIVTILAVTVAAALNNSAAFAQASRTFVSGQGADSGTCALGAPCRSFAYAIGQTATGGEIAVLNTAGYGTVTINTAISIVNQDGVEAGITVASGVGVTVAAGANDVVKLGGLIMTGGGAGSGGITFTSGKTLNIQNCIVRGFTQTGIDLIPSTVGAVVNISDTIISNNNGDGIAFAPGASGGAYFQRVQALGNGNDGFDISGFGGAPLGSSIEATVADSVASGNGTGFRTASAVTVPTANLTVTNSKAANNATGLMAQGGTINIALTTLSGNTQGFSTSSGNGTILSFHNNNIVDTNNSGSLGTIGVQ